MNKQQFEFEIEITSADEINLYERTVKTGTKDILNINYTHDNYIDDCINISKQVQQATNNTDMFLYIIKENIHRFTYDIVNTIRQGVNSSFYEAYDNMDDYQALSIDFELLNYNEYIEYLKYHNVYNKEYKALLEFFEVNTLFEKDIYDIDEILMNYNYYIKEGNDNE